MFSLVIAIVSIALVVAAVIVGGYYGGSGISDATAQADAARLKNEEQQIMAAVDVFNADKGRYPNDLQELVDTGYLKSIPRGGLAAMANLKSSGITVADLLAVAQAYAAGDVAQGWQSPVAGEPVFETTSNVPALTCAKYNQASRGDDGILKQAFTSQRAQCYGVDGDYKIVISKVGGGTNRLADAIGASNVLDGDLPAANGSVYWDKLPSGDIKVVTDPGKKPFSKLVMSPDGSTGDDFGYIGIGNTVTSATRTVVNQGNIAATGIALSAPVGFSIVGSSCASSLGPGASCAFALSFSPTAFTTYSGNVMLASDNGGTLSYPVLGLGRVAQIRISPTTATFGVLQSGQTALSGVFTARNDGANPTSKLSFNLPTDFNLVNNTCGAQIVAGSSCSFQISFEPTQAQAYNGTVSLWAANAGMAVVSVTGTAQVKR